MRLNVELKSVARHYGRVKAVDGVSFSAGPGEVVALVGHNGAGKTTLIKLMLGLARPTAGSVTVLGEDPTAGDAAVRRRLGYLPENVSFNPALTGRETLRFYVRLKGGKKSEENALLERMRWVEVVRVREPFVNDGGQHPCMLAGAIALERGVLHQAEHYARGFVFIPGQRAAALQSIR